MVGSLLSVYYHSFVSEAKTLAVRKREDRVWIWPEAGDLAW